MESATSPVVKSTWTLSHPDQGKEQTTSFTSCKLWHWMSTEHSGVRLVLCQWSLIQGEINTNYCTVYMSKNPEGTTCTTPSIYHEVTDTTNTLKPRYYLGEELNEEREIWKTKNFIPKRLINYLKESSYQGPANCFYEDIKWLPSRCINVFICWGHVCEYTFDFQPIQMFEEQRSNFILGSCSYGACSNSFFLRPVWHCRHSLRSLPKEGMVQCPPVQFVLHHQTKQSDMR